MRNSSVVEFNVILKRFLAMVLVCIMAIGILPYEGLEGIFVKESSLSVEAAEAESDTRTVYIHFRDESNNTGAYADKVKEQWYEYWKDNVCIRLWASGNKPLEGYEYAFAGINISEFLDSNTEKEGSGNKWYTIAIKVDSSVSSFSGLFFNGSYGNGFQSNDFTVDTNTGEYWFKFKGDWWGNGNNYSEFGRYLECSTTYNDYISSRNPKENVKTFLQSSYECKFDYANNTITATYISQSKMMASIDGTNYFNLNSETYSTGFTNTITFKYDLSEKKLKIWTAESVTEGNASGSQGNSVDITGPGVCTLTFKSQSTLGATSAITFTKDVVIPGLLYDSDSLSVKEEVAAELPKMTLYTNSSVAEEVYPVYSVDSEYESYVSISDNKVTVSDDFEDYNDGYGTIYLNASCQRDIDGDGSTESFSTKLKLKVCEVSYTYTVNYYNSNGDASSEILHYKKTSSANFTSSVSSNGKVTNSKNSNMQWQQFKFTCTSKKISIYTSKSDTVKSSVCNYVNTSLAKSCTIYMVTGSSASTNNGISTYLATVSDKEPAYILNKSSLLLYQNNQVLSEADNKTRTYNGQEIVLEDTKFVLNTSSGKIELTEGEDYSLTYENNINAGTGIVRLATLSDQYLGIEEYSFVIEKINLAKKTNDDSTVNYTVTMSENGFTTSDSLALSSSKSGVKSLKDLITLKTSKGIIIPSDDYDIKVYKKNDDSTYTLENTFDSADGNEQTPGTYAIALVAKDTALNIESATYGLDGGIITGSTSNLVAFKVADSEFKLSNYSVSLSGTGISDDGSGNYSATYTGTVIRPTVKVTQISNGVEVASKNYSVDYSNNTDAGTATIRISQTSEWVSEEADRSSITVTFTIKPVNVADNEVTASIPDATYTGTVITPVVSSIKYKTDTTLKNGTDYTLSYADNTNAGTAKVKFTFTGNYTGTVTKNFTINKADFNSNAFTMEVSPTKAVYDGTKKSLTVKVKFNGTEIDSSQYTTNVNDLGLTSKGVYTIKAVAKESSGNYTGTITKTFEIESQSISSASVSFDKTSYSYNAGNEIKPVLTLTYKGTKLVQDTDYTVEFSDNCLVSTDDTKAKATITGIGNFSGSIVKEFVISKTVLNATSTAVSVVGGTSYTFKGEEITPSLTVTNTLDGVTTTLVSGQDYSVTYKDNTNAGTATVEITGKGNYTSSVSEHFTIDKAELSACDISLKNDNCVYTGAACKPEIVVKLNGITIPADMYNVTYDNNINSGTLTAKATVTVSDTSSLSDSTNAGKVIYFSIAGTKFEVGKNVSASLASTVTSESLIYTGTDITPALDVKVNGETVSLGSDYTVSYSNNINAGTAIATISGTGAFNGSFDFEYTIEKRDISTYATVVFSNTNETLIYDGSAKTRDVTVSCTNYAANNHVLTKDTDYTVSYSNNTNAGYSSSTNAPKVTVTGKGNFTGTKSLTYTINPCDITDGAGGLKSGYTVALNSGSLVFDGTAKEPAIIFQKGGNTFSSDNYTVLYSDNINAGTATVTVNGKGNYTGSYSFSFPIEKAKLSDCSVTLAKSSYKADTNGISANIASIKYTFGSNTYTLQSGEYVIKNYLFENEDGSYTSIAGKDDNYKVSSGASDGSSEYLPIASGRYKLVIEATSSANFIGTNETAVITIGDSLLNENIDLYIGGSDASNMVNFSGICPVTATERTQSANGSYPYKQLGEKVTYGTGLGSYIIYRASSDTNVIEYNGNYTYSGAAVGPELIVRKHSDSEAAAADDYTNSLVLNRDYTITSYNNINATGGEKTAYILIEGKGSYTGTIRIEYEIKQLDISSASVESTDCLEDSSDENCIGSYEYTATSIKPNVKVNLYDLRSSSKLLTSSTDYEVSYSNNLNYYEYGISSSDMTTRPAVKITGKGNFTGTKTVYFDITKTSISNASLKLEPTQYTYDGLEKKPNASLVVNGYTVSSSYYTLSYYRQTGETTEGKAVYEETSDLTSAGVVVVYASPTADSGIDISGTKTYVANMYQISRLVLNSYNSTVSVEDIDYKSRQDEDYFKVEPTVTCTGLGISADSVSLDEFDISYSFNKDDDDNVVVGLVRVTLTAKDESDFSGKLTAIYNVKATAITEDNTTISLVDKNPIYYDGDSICPSVYVICDGVRLIENTDYSLSYENNTNATSDDSKAKIIVTGIGNYGKKVADQVELEFDIESTDLSMCDISFNSSDLTEGTDEYTVAYDADKVPYQPGVIVKYKGVVLDSADYNLTYSNNENSGIATVTVSGAGNGNLTGQVSMDFHIVGTTLADGDTETPVLEINTDLFDLSINDSIVYTGSAITRNVVSVTYTAGTTDSSDDVELVVGRDYEISYENNINASTEDNMAKFMIVGRGAYEGTFVKEFFINRATIEDDWCSLEVDEYTYDGQAFTPQVTVANGDIVLVEGQDYELTYEDNVMAGTAICTIVGLGNYKGTVTKTFTILSIANDNENADNSGLSDTNTASQTSTASNSESGATVEGNSSNTVSESAEEENFVGIKVAASVITKSRLAKKQTFKVKATAYDCGKISYKSNNKKIKISKTGKVTVAKNYIGKAKITLTATATDGSRKTATVMIYVLPPATKIKALKKLSAGQMSVTYKTVKDVTGYEITYSTNKNFTKKTTKTIKVKANNKDKAKTLTQEIAKLKGKKYYVKVRSYSKVKGKTYYSLWSKVKKIKL